MLSLNPFQIKVDIYEQDIVNVKVDDFVKITLVAFPNQIFYGKILSIDPAEKIIDNVVYYQTTIDFDGNQEKTGLEGNEYFEVLSGLSEGDQIITGKK